MIDAILFDVDGTLIDVKDFTYLAYSHAFDIFGVRQVSNREIDATMGLSLMDSYRSLAGVSESTLAAMIEEHRRFQRDNFELIKPFPGTLKTLRALKKRSVKLAAVTSRIYNVHEILKRTGLLSHLEVIVTGADVKNFKPHPESVYLTLEKLGLKTDNVIIVGDTDADILAGKQSGIRTFAVSSGFYSEEELLRFKPDFIGNDVSAILELFDS